MKSLKQSRLPNININKFPQNIQKNASVSPIAFSTGDSHANGLGILHILIRENILKGIDKTSYEDFANHIYPKSVENKDNPLKPADLAKFNRMLRKATLNKDYINSSIQFIGDEVCDRGESDYYVLAILEKLVDEGAKLRIAVSNHGIEPIKLYELGHKFDCRGPWTAATDTKGLLAAEHSRSMLNLQKLIDSKDFPDITRAKIDAQIKKIYGSHLKLFFYNLNESADEISFYSHAGVGLETIRDIAKAFKLPYKDKTAKELAGTIDKINQKFTNDYVNRKKVHELFPTQEMDRLYTGIVTTNNPFVRLIWNRRYENLERPAVHHHYKINYIHGHDPSDPAVVEGHIYNIDNGLGKGLANHTAEYKMLYAYNNDLKIKLDEKIKTKSIPMSKFSLLVWAGIGLGAAIAAGFTSVGMIGATFAGTILGLVFSKIRHYFIENAVQNYLAPKQIIKIKNKSELDSLKAGVAADSWLGYAASFANYKTYIYPSAFKAGEYHAVCQNESMIEKINKLSVKSR